MSKDQITKEQEQFFATKSPHTNDPLNKKAVRNAVFKTSLEKAVAMTASEPVIVYWDGNGIARAFLVTKENVHFTIPVLKGIKRLYSIPV